MIAAGSLAAAGSLLLLLLSLIPIWPFVLLEHFRVQIVVGALVVAFATGVLRIRGYFDVALIALCCHALWLVPDLTRARRPVPPGTKVRVLLLNVLRENSQFAEVRALIGDVKPDVIGLVEIDYRWVDGVALAVAGYQRLEHPRRDNFGLALYAKIPLTGHVEDVRGYPTIFAELALPSGPLQIVLVHPIPPVSAAALDDQIAVLDSIVPHVQGPTIVMGDFNATPWSRPFLRFVGRTGLCDSRAGFGLQASFPASTWTLRIPIDHLLASCSIGIADRYIERNVGSDHLPIVLDIVVPRMKSTAILDRHP